MYTIRGREKLFPYAGITLVRSEGIISAGIVEKMAHTGTPSLAVCKLPAKLRINLQAANRFSFFFTGVAKKSWAGGFVLFEESGPLAEAGDSFFSELHQAVFGFSECLLLVEV